MKSGLKAVVDTNVVISAVIGKSATFVKIYNAFVDNLFTPILSPSLQEEIFNVVKKPRIKKYFRAEEIKRFQELIKVDALLVVPAKKISICRDTKDNMLLEAAAEAKADFIVTGDEDLLTLKSCSGIPIVSPGQFAGILNRL